MRIGKLDSLPLGERIDRSPVAVSATPPGALLPAADTFSVRRRKQDLRLDRDRNSSKCEKNSGWIERCREASPRLSKLRLS